MMRNFCQIFGSVYPLRGAVRVTVRARVYNLRPITPYLDENLTSPSNTLFLSMINDQISRLKNTFLLPKGEMPNYSHLERPSLVVEERALPCQKAIQTPFQSSISRNSLTSTRRIEPSFGRSSLQCSALTPVDGWIFHSRSCSELNVLDHRGKTNV